MRRFMISLLLSAFVVLGSFGLGSFVYADTSLTPDQTAKIQANCVTIKNTLNQLHASDALLRVNRGQLYESMATNLMDTFNTRLSNNSLDNKAMTTVTDAYRSQLNTFRSDYIAYEQKLSDAITIDCTKNPSGFHDAIQTARALRSTVHDDVTKLGRSIDDYRSSVSDFFLNYQRISQ
ncbi:MAG TPA: hypothetical protein VN081_03660 [Dongiaceae bacterium]|nr:hypothetical protein [Dongiaceae bacterium]